MKLHDYQKITLLMLLTCVTMQAAERFKTVNELLLEAVLKGDAKKTESLLKQKANPCYQSSELNSIGLPLSFAAFRGHEAMVTLLLQAKANVNQLNHRKETPLACAIQGCSVACARQLLRAGAKLDPIDWHRMIPFTFCADVTENSDMIAFLLARDTNTKKRGIALSKAIQSIGTMGSRPMVHIIKMIYISHYEIPSYPHTIELSWDQNFGSEGTITSTYKNIITEEEAKKFIAAIEKEKELLKAEQEKLKKADQEKFDSAKL